MADRRCFSNKIVGSDAFLEMPLSSQALYFQFGMAADDDGFVNSPRRLVRYVGASEDDFKLLIAKRFIFYFDEGIVVIKHWRMHNTLKNDRLKLPQYPEVAARIYIKANKSYTDDPKEGELSLLEVKTRKVLVENSVENPVESWIPNGFQMDSKRNILDSQGKGREVEQNLTERNLTEVEDEAMDSGGSDRLAYLGGIGKGVVLLTQDQMDSLLEKLDIAEFDYYVEKLADFILKHPSATIKSHYKTILKWVKEDRET